MRERALGFGFLVCSLLGLASAHAAAQTAPAAPDVVRLRDGGLLRGTIAELVPSDHVTILLITGETRRIAAAEVAFAGPVEEAPRPPTAPAALPTTPSGDTAPPTSAPTTTTAATTTATAASADAAPPTGAARVRFRGVEGSRVVVDAARETDGTPSFARVCTTPCSLVMPIGAYHVALTSGALPRLTIEHLVPIEDRDLVTVEYETRNGTRTGGLVLIGITAAAGVGVGLSPLAMEGRSRDAAILPAIVGGLAIAGIGTLIGLLMHGADDAAHSTVTHHEERDPEPADD
jgi:hypothetical protein